MTQHANITPVTTDSPQALMTLVQQAIATRTPIVDYGLAHRGLGHRPPDRHYLLTQQATGSGIIDHYDRDMTVRVAGGATLGQVNKALQASNQCVPLDVDPDLTIAEIVATNAYGPLRLTYGGPRDLLLGLHYIDGLGRDIQVGGRTVKNVAGLDVTRLMVGSLGELGLIHQATFRTYAMPEHVLAVDVSIDDPARIGSFLTDWIITDASPAWMTLEHAHDQWCIRLAYQGKHSACASQLHSLQRMAELLGGMHIIGSADSTYEKDLAEHQARRSWQRSASTLVKVIVPPASTGQVIKALHTFDHALQGRLNAWAILSHGVVYAGGDLTTTQALELDRVIHQATSPLGGVRLWITRPQGSEDALSPFDPIPTELPLLRRLKNTMDPHHLFNPGRCITQEPSQP